MKMKKLIVRALTGIVIIGICTSCQQEFFKDELYRKEIYVVSGDNNIFGREFTFGGSKSSLSIYGSGTTELEQDVKVTLVRDANALAEYNKRNFDQSFDKYTLEMPEQYYTIDDMNVMLTPDQPYTMLPISVNTDEMSPDEIYFIPLRIKSVSNYMVSKTKNFVLFRIYTKNDYATTMKDTYYKMNGTMRQGKMTGNNFESTEIATSMGATKLVRPISTNSIRIMPASNHTDKKTELRNWGIKVTVVPDQTVDIPILDEGQPTGEFVTMQKVTIAPYIDSNNALDVRMIDTNPCYYDKEKNTFKLFYRYKLAGDSKWYEISETMVNDTYKSVSI